MTRRWLWWFALTLIACDADAPNSRQPESAPPVAQAAPSPGSVTSPAAEPARPRPSSPIPPLIDPVAEAHGEAVALESPAALMPFFAALDRMQGNTSLVRVTHMGDSSIGLDGLPHSLRRAFQEEFGDGGPGYVNLQPHSTSYINRTVHLANRVPWERLCFIIRRCHRDGYYGLGGVSVESRGGARSHIRPRRGRNVSSAELYYAERPRGGRIEFRFGSRRREIDTRAQTLRDGYARIELPPGRHSTSVHALGHGPVRAFGVVLESEGPGIVWDTLSMIGAFTHRLLAHDESHFADQLSHRDPDLVVINYGGNDLRRFVGGVVDQQGLTQETSLLLRRIRRAVPGAACLLLAINDHQRSGERTIRPPDVRAVVNAQRAAASEAGCAFWDTTAAMGGAGSFGRWLRAGLASDDGKHLSAAGRRVIARRLYAALMHARQTRQEAGVETRP